MIRLEDIHVSYGERPALRGLSLAVPAGELLPVLGPSGAGKTTLLRVVAGLVRPQAGRVWLTGRLVNDPRPLLPPHKRGLAMVFQDLALWPHMTVYGNVAFPLRHLPRRERRARVLRILARVELADQADRLPETLSGGEQQRVALARALVTEPRILLLDEPLANLDARLRDDLLLLMRALVRDFHLTALYVTHDRNEALTVGRRLAVLLGGRIVQCGPAEVLYRSPAHPFVATALGATNLFYVRADAPARPLPDAPPGGPPPAGGRLAALPPQGLAVAAAGPLAGTVAAAVFRGDHWILHVQAGTLHLRVRHNTPLSEGTAVKLRLTQPPVFFPDGT